MANITGKDLFKITFLDNGTARIEDFNLSFSGSLVIPSKFYGKDITEIGSAAFDGCGNLTNIIIPNTVTSIGKEAMIAK